MRKRAKTIAIVGGVAAVIGAATVAEKSRGWKHIHKVASGIGFLAAIVGRFA